MAWRCNECDTELNFHIDEESDDLTITCPCCNKVISTEELEDVAYYNNIDDI